MPKMLLKKLDWGVPWWSWLQGVPVPSLVQELEDPTYHVAKKLNKSGYRV